MTLSDQIVSLKKKLDSSKLATEKKLEEIQINMDKLQAEVFSIVDHWQGSWSEDTDVYTDFIRNTPSLIQLRTDDLVNYAINKCGVDLKDVEKEASQILKDCKSLREEFIIELSIIKPREELNEQNKLLSKLETFKWGYTPDKYIESQRPKYFMGNYQTTQRLLNKGWDVPPHTSILADLFARHTQIAAIESFFKLSSRLIRELELVISINKDDFKKFEISLTNLENLIDRFHYVARQMEHRHNDRTTLKISDEYDTQDLLHALLKIHFDDIRPEEYAPSHAGKKARTDFLLKKEKIVIEVKKTRSTLKDGKVGNELLQDIARYRNHPDCEILYCFIYDPQGLIANPRGLEDDLNSESSDQLKVLVRIKP